MVKFNIYSYIIVTSFVSSISSLAYAVEFNTDMLDTEDTQNIDFSQFSQAGFIMPGIYHLTLKVNNESMGSAQDITVIAPQSQNNNLFDTVCVPVNILDRLGLTQDAIKLIKYRDEGKCLDLSPLEGASLNVDLSTLTLSILIPQSYLEYTDPSWVPPSRWEEGVNGFLLDYNLTGSLTRRDSGSRESYLSANGTTGLNFGAWRLRGDYQANYRKSTGSFKNQYSDATFSRLFAYRSIKSIASILTLGENYFYSAIFDSWQYTGVSLETDENMMPPKLTGYAPEIIGIAQTNATVIVKSHNRIVLETTVPAGPFRIQTLDSSIRGTLDVTVREENGEEQQFSITTAALPYLTRPGQIRYKFAAGKPRFNGRQLEGDLTASGELSYGLNNLWSIYGGSVLSKNYQAFSAGFGRDLFSFGSLSFDATQSHAQLLDKTLTGRSYRLSYSKSFDEARTDITFAGYRFSDETYRSLQQTLDERRTGNESQAQKESYQVNINKYFDDFSLGGNYQYNTYWNSETEEQYSLYLSTLLNWAAIGLKNINLTASATRSKRAGYQDDAISLYFTIPLSQGSSVSFSEGYTRNQNGQHSSTHNIGYSGYSEQRNYNLNVGYQTGSHQDDQTSFSGYLNQNLPYASISGNASYVPNEYHSVGGSINGGITLIKEGIAMHQAAYGGTRLVVETPGAANVPLSGGVYQTNHFGLAVLPNVSSYRKTSASINTSKLPKDVEALETVTDATLTRGAIGYRRLNVIQGEKTFARLKLADDTYPPFGTSVRNSNNIELGIVGEQGITWIVGIQPKDLLNLYWGNKHQCSAHVPDVINPQEIYPTIICR
ncbi:MULTISPECIES: fimbria/pilus outer membrane usher protein [Providencia]|uniref:fimbria/pilus outer membrane usher protein n=1 Tax=Providencia TaxID=586 RepID=UPI000D7DA13E|nr:MULTISPECIES: fimbria/pilus outer membrane usher protein [Providencia]AWS52884.1 fimbrial assembly protein [Providencia rettgeri]ELR5289339.1 fimbria/pilus outer membrane usher protein [Providencia rettgeri]EMC8780671.1 fimbria/pilus outer membrane usher protein [Providencia rettgeri]MBG5922913.1 fimbria/pilus outer membrane usher protein [Providencia rettgeri]MCG5292553.1 fimbria/pilus outer membrane usher protein [Providencia rettgeri]